MHTQWHTLGARSHTWWLDTDALLISDVARRASAGIGVLLYGEPGAGQDEVAGKVVQRLGARNGLLEIACPPDAETTQQLDRLVEDPPAPGRVLFIPDLSSFDGSCVEQVSRLVVRHGAVVVAVSSDPQGDPETTLSQYLRLDRVRVLDLSRASATEYLQRGLRGPVSDRASYAIWNSAAGNRSMMRMIAADWIEMDFLVQEGGIWVIRSPDFPAGPRLVRHWKQRLDQLDPPMRRVFELLALAHELPLDIVLEIGGSAVDVVHELGYLHLRDSAGRDASLRGIINSAAIADQVPPARSRELLDQVIEQVESLGISRPIGLISWNLRCGRPVPPVRFVEGAEHYLRYVTPMQALGLLKMLRPDEVPERAAGVRIGTLLAAGYFMDAGSLAGLLGQGNLPGAVSHAISPATVSAMALVRDTWNGDFRPLLGHSDQPELPEGLSWLWQALIHEAQVVTGEAQAGLQGCRELLRLLEQTDSAPFLIQRSRLGLFDLEMMAGEWDRAVGTLGGGWDTDSTAPGREGRGALYTALAEVMAGRFDACLEHLRREIPQLRALGRFDILSPAYSIRAFALAYTGNRQEALSALAAVEYPDVEESGGIWRLRWTGGFFWAQAMAMVGWRDRAISWLMTWAVRDRELGNASQELMSLSAALQWGHAPALELLEEAARRADGRFAEACMWVARGLRSRDLRELEYGALLLRSLGQYLFADYVQEQLEHLNVAVAATRTTLSRPVAEDGQLPSEYRRAGRTARASLTPRQRVIVDCVLADDSNTEIAHQLGLSVRTIESHLYQAYAKLNVANRVELRGLLDDD